MWTCLQIRVTGSSNLETRKLSNQDTCLRSFNAISVIHILFLLENLDLLLFLLYSVSYICLFDGEVLYEELDSLEVYSQLLCTFRTTSNQN